MNSDGKYNASTGHPLAFWRSHLSVKRNALRMPVPNLSPCVRRGLRFVILIRVNNVYPFEDVITKAALSPILYLRTAKVLIRLWFEPAASAVLQTEAYHC